MTEEQYNWMQDEIEELKEQNANLLEVIDELKLEIIKINNK